MQLSARNTLKGKIQSLKLGSVEAEVTLELSPGNTITAVITRASAERLELKEGMHVQAIVKASDVMIAVD